MADMADKHPDSEKLRQLAEALRAVVLADERARLDELEAASENLWLGPSAEALESHLEDWDRRHPAVVAARAALAKAQS